MYDTGDYLALQVLILLFCVYCIYCKKNVCVEIEMTKKEAMSVPARLRSKVLHGDSVLRLRNETLDPKYKIIRTPLLHI